MTLLTSALATAVLALNLASIVGFAVLIGRKFGIEFSFLKQFEEYLSDYSKETVLLTATVATLGSLYLSNILGYEPCRLCWFQRILMYPIVSLAATSIYLELDNLKEYVMPLVLIGIPLAFYHSVIQRIEQFSSAGCSITSVSCSTQYTFHYGYITIPVMALTAFLVIAVVLWKYHE